MEHEIIRETRRIYLRQKVHKQKDSLILHMLTENTIPGLVPCELRHMDGDTYLYYKITGLHSLSDLYDGRVMPSDKMAELIRQLWAVSRDLGDYFVPSACLGLSPQEIFYDTEEQKYLFLIFPGRKEEGLEGFLNYLITVVDHSDEAFSDRIYELREKGDRGFLLLEEAVTDLDLEANGVFVSSEEEKDDCLLSDPLYPETEETDVFSDAVTDPVADKKGKRSGKNPKKIRKEWKTSGLWKRILPVILCLLLAYALGTYLKMHPLAILSLELLILAAFLLRTLILRRTSSKERENLSETEGREEEPVEEEDTEVLWRPVANEAKEEAGLSTLYMETVEKAAVLFGQGTFRNWMIPLEEDSLTIGKDAGLADVVIPDPTVSRVHARIVRENGPEYTYKLKDLTSTNGTFVDSKRMEPQEEREIGPGSRVAFGKATFEFGFR